MLILRKALRDIVKLREKIAIMAESLEPPAKRIKTQEEEEKEGNGAEDNKSLWVLIMNYNNYVFINIRKDESVH